jgi:tetratricopeptide (TPR) repeat protein
MSDELRTQIYNNLILRDTEDLLEIWQSASTDEWSEDVFDILKEILTERLGEVPPQPAEKQVPQILRKVEKHLERNELDLAFSQCELAIQLDPNSAIAYNYLGEIHDQQGQLDPAILNYQRAIQLDEELKQAWENLLGVEAELEEEFERSGAKQHLDRALEYAYEDEPEKALEECALARSTLPGIAIAHNYLGMILETLDQLEPAITSYLKAMQLNPRFYAARENLANARVRLAEEQYLRAANRSLDEIMEAIETGREFHNNLDPEEENDGVPVPGWWYLDANAFLLRGWAGHRTRPGRSGYDPLDRDFELAHVEGVVIRRLLTIKFRTRNPFYLLVMAFLGLFFSWPLFCFPMIILGDINAFPVMIMGVPHLIIGIAFLINVIVSLQLAGSGEYNDEEYPTFF